MYIWISLAQEKTRATFRCWWGAWGVIPKNWKNGQNGVDNLYQSVHSLTLMMLHQAHHGSSWIKLMDIWATPVNKLGIPYMLLFNIGTNSSIMLYKKALLTTRPGNTDWLKKETGRKRQEKKQPILNESVPASDPVKITRWIWRVTCS